MNKKISLCDDGLWKVKAKYIVKEITITSFDFLTTMFLVVFFTTMLLVILFIITLIYLGKLRQINFFQIPGDAFWFYN